MELTLLTEFPADPVFAEEWNNLVETSHANGPFMRFDYLKTWWQHRGGGEWPLADLALVVGRREGRLAAVAPLFRAPEYRGQPSLMLVGSVEVSDYLDILAQPEDMPGFAAQLLDFLPRQSLPDWKGLDLFNILESSPSLPALEEAARARGWSAEITRAYHCPMVPIPGDWETYLAGIDKKQRHEIRRKIRRLENSETANSWYTVTDGDALEQEIDDFTALMEQDEAKMRFLTPPMRAFFRDVCRWAWKEGILMLSFLVIDGKKAAGYLSFDSLNRLWVYNSGIDRSLNEYSPGWVLLAYLLRWCNEQKREAFDFMRGDEEYKYRFGGVDRYVMRALLNRPA